MYTGNDFECLLSNIQSNFWKKATLEQLKHLKTTVYSYICWEKKKNKPKTKHTWEASEKKNTYKQTDIRFS